MDEFKEKVFKIIFLNTQSKNDQKNAQKKGGKKNNKSARLIE